MADTFTFAGFEFPRQIPMLKAPTKYRKSRLCCAYRPAPTPLTRDTQFTSFYLNERDYMKGDFQPGLRWEWCDEVAGVRMGHHGWFVDDSQADTYRGMVFRLPKARGFIIGYSMGGGMASDILYDQIYTTEAHAARAADSAAESAAEKSREWFEEEEARIKAEEDAAQALVDMQDAVNKSVDQAGWMLESANV
mgnify:CR=1 FL=1